VSKADEYRRKAEECRTLADTAISSDMKATWLELAEHWDRLAQSFERAGDLKAGRETHTQEGRSPAK
jgi:hypothetical protein